MTPAELKAIGKRPVLRGVAGQRRLSAAEKAEMGRLVNVRAYTVAQLAKRTRCGAESIKRWAAEAHADMEKADAAIKRIQAEPLKSEQSAWTMTKMDVNNPVYLGEANGNGAAPSLELGKLDLCLGLTTEDLREAVMFWMASKGVHLQRAQR